MKHGKPAVPLTLITFVNPCHVCGLGLELTYLPKPAGRLAEVMNVKRQEEAKELEIVPVARKKVLDNGRKVEWTRFAKGANIAATLAAGRFYAFFIQMGNLQKLEFYFGETPAEAPGLLNAEQFEYVLGCMYRVDYVCIKALWINPKMGGEVANIVLSPAIVSNHIIQQKQMRSKIRFVDKEPYIIEPED